MRGIKETAMALADMMMPRHCAVCGSKLETEEKHICGECAADIPYTYYWDRKHNPMADRLNGMIQQDIESYEAYSCATALFIYDDNSAYRNVCHELKYRGNIPLGKHFSRILAEKLASSPLFADADVLIPVPLHLLRKWKRGYNQAEIIAGELAKSLNLRLCTNVLKRQRFTRTQTALDKEGKRLNVSSAFRLDGKEAAKLSDIRHILLIDDVFTTGATAAACHKTLREAFPHPVRISTVSLAAVEMC